MTFSCTENKMRSNYVVSGVSVLAKKCGLFQLKNAQKCFLFSTCQKMVSVFTESWQMAKSHGIDTLNIITNLGVPLCFGYFVCRRIDHVQCLNLLFYRIWGFVCQNAFLCIVFSRKCSHPTVAFLCDKFRTISSLKII